MAKAPKYTAVIQRHSKWWIGWIEEVPGVNSQDRTRRQLLANLKDALKEAIEISLTSPPAQARLPPRAAATKPSD